MPQVLYKWIALVIFLQLKRDVLDCKIIAVAV